MVGESESSKQEKSGEKIAKEKSGSFLSTLAASLFWLVVGATMLWNWDGFWHTDIKPLEKIQRGYFSDKYNEEQMKVSRIASNNKLIEDIHKRLERAESRADLRVEKANKEMDMLLSKLGNVERELNSYLEKENTKCRYFDTSLRMIDHLAKKYSEDEFKRVLTCTSAECENILHYRQEARSICD